MSIISSCFSFVFFIVFEPSVSFLLLLPCPYGIFFIFVHVWDRFRLLLFLVLSGFPFFCALCLLPSLLFPPLCCTCWRLMSNMKIGTTAGTYSMCIVLGSFQEGIRAKKESALIWSQWIHILLLCFFGWPVFFL